MKPVTHTLVACTPGTTHQLTSLHFGPNGTGRKVYMQAALHADETPAILVAHTLRGKLATLEAAGRLKSAIVLVPVCNPIGLGQFVLGNFIGRFDLGNGQNYNRGYRFLHDEIAAAIEGKLCDDAAKNVRVIRAAWRTALEAVAPIKTFDSLQQTLMLLAHDADITLDLHCSREASMHLYTCEAVWPEVEPLARYLRSPVQLLALDAGGQPFDEAHSYAWYMLQQKFGQRFPIPHGNVTVTIEHRGQKDVSYEDAESDAQGIIDYLTHAGHIDGAAPPMPPLLHPATPLAGSEQFNAPLGGVLVYRAKMGDLIRVGQALFDIVDPITSDVTTVVSRTEGIFYMGRDTRWVRHGEAIGRVSGSKVIRAGKLLSA